MSTATDFPRLNQQRQLQHAAATETARGALVGVAVLKRDGQIASRGYSYPKAAMKWANAYLDHGLGEIAYLYNTLVSPANLWRFGKDQDWEAF